MLLVCYCRHAPQALPPRLPLGAAANQPIQITRMVQLIRASELLETLATHSRLGPACVSIICIISRICWDSLLPYHVVVFLSGSGYCEADLDVEYLRELNTPPKMRGFSGTANLRVVWSGHACRAHPDLCTTSRPANDMGWWFNTSNYDVKIVLLTKIDSGRHEILVEKWDRHLEQATTT